MNEDIETPKYPWVALMRVHRYVAEWMLNCCVGPRRAGSQQYSMRDAALVAAACFVHCQAEPDNKDIGEPLMLSIRRATELQHDLWCRAIQDRRGEIGVLHYGADITAELITNEMQREIFRKEPVIGEIEGAPEASSKRPVERKVYDVGPSMKDAFTILARWPEGLS